MVKLAILGTRGIPARYGGFETFAEQLATKLVTHDVDVTVFCPASRPKQDDSYRGVTLRYIKFPNLGKYSEMFWDARCFFEARGQFDVVYMLGLGGAFAAWVPRVFGSAVWVNTDGVEWKRTKFNWPQRAYLALMEALSVLFASRIIADAGAIASYLRGRYPGLKRVSTIAYGADVPESRPAPESIKDWGLQPDGYYVIVSRLEPENHLLEMVEGFELSHSELPLVILGNIENPNTYVQRLLAHQSKRIRFIGTVYDRANLEPLRFFARAYLHGHSVGGTNPSLLEAMACSNLVIAHDNPFNREVLGECGLFFRNPRDLSSQIHAIDAGEVKIQVLRDGVLARIKKHYTWDQIAQLYLELLRRT